MPAYEPWDAGRGAEIIAKYTHLEGATLVILHALQEAFGYVPESAIPMVAEALNLSRAEGHGVFTFYHDFRHKPGGKHVLKRCRAEACQAAGGDARAARAGAKLVPVRLRDRALGDARRPPGRKAGRSAHRRADRGGTAMKMRIFVPRDAAAISVGADEVVAALEQAAAKRDVPIQIIRNGSRGLMWLEPMIEVATVKGRVAYGPVTPADVPSLLDAMASNGPHALRLGLTEEIPWL